MTNRLQTEGRLDGNLIISEAMLGRRQITMAGVYGAVEHRRAGG